MFWNILVLYFAHSIFTVWYIYLLYNWCSETLRMLNFHTIYCCGAWDTADWLFLILSVFSSALFWRYGLFEKQLALLEEAEGGFDQFTRSYKSYGVQRKPDNSLVFKEWAPAAEALFLTGDFSMSFLILNCNIHVYDSVHQWLFSMAYNITLYCTMLKIHNGFV